DVRGHTVGVFAEPFGGDVAAEGEAGDADAAVGLALDEEIYGEGEVGRFAGMVHAAGAVHFAAAGPELKGGAAPSHRVEGGLEPRDVVGAHAAFDAVEQEDGGAVRVAVGELEVEEIAVGGVEQFAAQGRGRGPSEEMAPDGLAV